MRRPSREYIRATFISPDIQVTPTKGQGPKRQLSIVLFFTVFQISIHFQFISILSLYTDAAHSSLLASSIYIPNIHNCTPKLFTQRGSRMYAKDTTLTLIGNNSEQIQNLIL